MPWSVTGHRLHGRREGTYDRAVTSEGGSMAGSESYFSTAVGLLRKTMPFLALNAMIYGAFALATVAWIAIWIGIVILAAKASPALAWVMIFIAFAVPGGVLYWGKRWLLYMVKGAHIAVLTKVFFQQPIPDGKG